jgi:hypothetical protein
MQKLFLRNGKDIEISNLEAKDIILGPNGSSKTVLSKRDIEDDIFKITPVKGDSFIISDSQRLSLVMSKDSRRSGFLLEIKPSDLMGNKKIIDSYKLYRTGINDIWQDNSLKIDPYFLGVLIGDGGGFNAGQSPTVSKPDPEIRNLVFDQASKWNLEIKEYGGLNPTYRFVRPGTGNGRIGLTRDSHSLKGELNSLGYKDVSCKDRFINDKYKFASLETRLEVLAGLLDTDGYYYSGGFEFTSKSKRLASDTQFLARSVGLAAYKRRVIKSCQNNFTGEYWLVSISGNCSIINNRISRKVADKRTSIKSVLRTGIKTIEWLKKSNHIMIEVDKDGLVLLDDFTVINFNSR